jgi:uncharacterized protein
MKYDHDPEKLAKNVRKHGVWFEQAEWFEWETALVGVDDRNQYVETRFEAIGYIEDRLHVMVFCLRETVIRIISLRKANRREVKRYAEA